MKQSKDMKKVLVVIDAQNDFIDGSLRNEEAIKAVPGIVEKISSFCGDAIFVTQDTHQENYLDTPEGKKLPVIHCVRGTQGWEINPQVKSALDLAKQRGINVTYIEKPTFGSYELVDSLKALGDNLDIQYVGFCTDICVVSNVLLAKAAFYDVAKLSVDSSCCAGVTPQSHQAALQTMQMCQVDIL